MVFGFGWKASPHGDYHLLRRGFEVLRREEEVPHSLNPLSWLGGWRQSGVGVGPQADVGAAPIAGSLLGLHPRTKGPGVQGRDARVQPEGFGGRRQLVPLQPGNSGWRTRRRPAVRSCGRSHVCPRTSVGPRKGNPSLCSGVSTPYLPLLGRGATTNLHVAPFYNALLSHATEFSSNTGMKPR